MQDKTNAVFTVEEEQLNKTYDTVIQDTMQKVLYQSTTTDEIVALCDLVRQTLHSKRCLLADVARRAKEQREKDKKNKTEVFCVGVPA